MDADIPRELAVVPARFRAAIDRSFQVTAANRAFLWRFGGRIGQDCRTFFSLASARLLASKYAELPAGRPGRFFCRASAIGVEGESFDVVVDGLTFRDCASRLLLVRAATEQVFSPERTCLTPMEAAILEGLAAGETTTAIAPRISLSRQGADYYVTSMMRSFRVPNRTALVAKAYHAGLMADAVWPPQVSREFVDA